MFREKYYAHIKRIFVLKFWENCKWKFMLQVTIKKKKKKKKDICKYLKDLTAIQS